MTDKCQLENEQLKRQNELYRNAMPSLLAVREAYTILNAVVEF